MIDSVPLVRALDLENLALGDIGRSCHLANWEEVYVPLVVRSCHEIIGQRDGSNCLANREVAGRLENPGFFSFQLPDLQKPVSEACCQELI